MGDNLLLHFYHRNWLIQTSILFIGEPDQEVQNNDDNKEFFLMEAISYECITCGKRRGK